jgi:predicted ester cyclase
MLFAQAIALDCRQLSEGSWTLDPLSKLLRRYCFAYTATHDFTVADQIMVDDYTFYMGEHVFVGREEAYKPAAERQFQAYPGLGFAVHDFFSNGDRCAMYFSEYGHSLQYATNTAWHGASLYRWNGERLTECRIEQDYYARRRQLVTKLPDQIDQPAYAPWTAPVEKANAQSEAVVSTWLKDGGLLKSQVGSLDDERVAPSIARVLLLNGKTDVVDIMSAGRRVAFQVKMTGQYAGGLQELSGHEGVDAVLYATGFADVEGGDVRNVKSVTDRYTMERRLLAAAKKR